LGYFRNVIVVTACDDCFGRNPHIAPWANYSTSGLVSLAAPGGSQGDPIISTADRNSYANAYGTSQAAAFVAGVAAELRSCNTGLTPYQIKERLVITASPILDGSINHKINSGVVNAEIALKLDPQQSYVALRADGRFQSLTDMHWCRSAIRVRHLTSGTADDDEPLDSKFIARIKSVQDPQSGELGFMIARSGKHDKLNHNIWTYSPVAVEARESKQALFSAVINRAGARRYVYPDDVDDLILSTQRVGVVQEDAACLVR
jgi:hypothetical protein